MKNIDTKKVAEKLLNTFAPVLARLETRDERHLTLAQKRLKKRLESMLKNDKNEHRRDGHESGFGR